MSRTCKNCGNTFEDHMNICPRCGMQYVEDAAMPAQNYGQPYQQQPGQPYQQPYVQPQYNQYAQPMQPVNEQPMSVGQWVGTILLTTMLGTISLILLFVWGFSNNTPTAKKNYCRAMLIVEAISLVLVILLVVVVIALTGGEFFSAIRNSYHY